MYWWWPRRSCVARGKLMAKAFKLTVKKNGVAELIFDLSGERVNILRSKVLLELEERIAEIAKNGAIDVLIIRSAKINNFIAGADINEIKDLHNSKEAYEIVAKGQEIISKIAALRCITVAYINGSCMGGGTELALACDYRLASTNSKTMLGLPEVNLGIIPGFGGTQRLPRLIGLSRSLQMILTGKAINYKKAYRFGLVDDFFPDGYAKERLEKFAQDIQQSKYARQLKRRRKYLIPIHDQLRFLHEFVFKKAHASLMKNTKGKYPAPLKAYDVIKNSYDLTLRGGLRYELKAFTKLAVTKTSKNLISLFFASEKVKKDKIKTKEKLPEIKKAGVLGAGIMGGGIAWLYSKIGVSVRIKDINNEALALGYQQIYKIYKQLLKIRKYHKSEVANKLALISATTDFSGFKNCDFISEAVIEDLKIKKQVIKELEKHVKAETIIASNSSALSITEMAKALKKPERFVGVHFFNPVNRMPLVEIIPGKKTSKTTIAAAEDFMRKCGKTPIIVGDCAGFLVNRILLTYINEAFHLLAETGAVKRIDHLIEHFGMPMGPFTLADTVGLDVGYKVAKTLEDAYGQRMQVAPIIEEIYCNRNLLGKKSGLGIYKYTKNKISLNLGLNELYAADNIATKDIIDRLILIMVNEAARCLEEKVVSSAAHLDLAMVMGTGFPAFTGGLVKYADNRGLKQIVKKLEALQEKYGDRFEPAAYLRKLAEAEQNFYDI